MSGTVSRRGAARRTRSRSRTRTGPTSRPAPYEKAYAEMMVAYDVASVRYRENGVLCPFPAGTFPPRIPTAREVL